MPVQAVAYAINKRTHKANRDRLCWSMASGSMQLENSATGATQYLDPVGVVQGITNEQIGKFNGRIQAAIIKRAQQIQNTIQEEMPPPKSQTQAEKDAEAADERENQATQKRVNEQAINPYAKYQNTNSQAK